MEVKMSCTCQKCGDKYKVDFLVPDKIWEQIKPQHKPVGAGLLCGKCIVEALEERGYSACKLIDLN
jgi:hypothetical protein